MKKRSFFRKGMTLSEMLVAVAILVLFVSMAMVGTSGLFGTAEEISVVSKAAVLGSDVMQIITNEIRYGESFSVGKGEGTVLKFNSASYGDDCSMFMEEGELVLTKTTTSKDAEGNATTETTTFKPIGTVAYDEVKIQTLTFALAAADETDGTKTTVTVHLAIVGDGKILWDHEVNIVPLFHKLTD